jgi:Tol biopolymer transport system component
MRREMREIIFLVEPDPAGGYTAQALGHSIFTEADTWDELKMAVQDAVRCHFEEDEPPTMTRLSSTWRKMKRIIISVLALIIIICAGACCTDSVPGTIVATSQTPTTTCSPTPTATPTSVSPPTPTPTLAATACNKLAFASGSSVYIVNLDGSSLVRVADVPGGYTPIGIQWSPDGKQLAYLNAKVDNPWAMNLYVMGADGTDQRLLADGPGGWTGYGWSPDGQYIWTEYCSCAGGCTFGLRFAESGEGVCGEYYLRETTLCLSECFPLELSDGRWWSSSWGWSRTMVVSGEDRMWALCPDIDLPDAFDARLSPDEKWVAFGAWDSTHAYSWRIARSNGNELRMVQARPSGEFCFHIGAWSPDSRSFAFATYEGDEVLVWTFDPTGKAESLVAQLEGGECPESVKWSAGSRYIRLLVNDHPDDGGAGQGVRMCTTSTTDDEVSCLPLSRVPETYSWSPDGYWLAYAGADLAVLQGMDGERTDLTTRHTREIEWSPTGRWLAFSTDRYPLADDDDEELYVFDLVTRETVQLFQKGTRAFEFSPSCN